jgi:hypothetical protein
VSIDFRRPRGFRASVSAIPAVDFETVPRPSWHRHRPRARLMPMAPSWSNVALRIPGAAVVRGQSHPGGTGHDGAGGVDARASAGGGSAAGSGEFAGIGTATELILKTVLTRRGTADEGVRAARVQPTTPIEVPAQEPVRDPQTLVAAALADRPELEEARLQIRNSHIALSGSRNELLPELNLVARAQSAGLAGRTNAALNGRSKPGNDTAGGVGTSLGQRSSFRYPTYTIGLQLTLPIRNRIAEGDGARPVAIAAVGGAVSAACRIRCGWKWRARRSRWSRRGQRTRRRWRLGHCRTSRCGSRRRNWRRGCRRRFWCCNTRAF